MNRRFKLVGMALACVLLLCPIPALSQGTGATQSPDMGDDRLDATGVGIAGGILVGGELVVITEALIKVDKLWAYLTFPFVGAAGGGVGGYYLEQASPEGAVAMLVGGLVLLVPSAILASKAMAYNPEKENGFDSDTEGVEKYSFEAAPTGKLQDEGTKTEVESRPEDSPSEGSLLRPGEEQTAEEKAPSPKEMASDSHLIEEKRLAKRARLRRATAGSLFYVDREGGTGFTVPFVDVRPARYAYNTSSGKPGVEVYLPLLRIDLP